MNKPTCPPYTGYFNQGRTYTAFSKPQHSSKMGKIEILLYIAGALLCVILACFFPVPAFAQTVGIHTVSHHFPSRGQNNNNPGLYVMSEDLWTVGGYRNSGRKNTFYAGKGFKFGPIDIGAALATGYKRECDENGCWGFSRWAVTPVVTLSYAAPALFGVSPRIWVEPPFGNAAAVVHLSVEHNFK